MRTRQELEHEIEALREDCREYSECVRKLEKRVEELERNERFREERHCADCGQVIPKGQELCNCNTSGDLG